MNIMACTFKRTARSKSEKGIIVNEGDGPIIDTNGKVVSAVWNYTTFPYEFCINLKLESIKVAFKNESQYSRSNP